MGQSAGFPSRLSGPLLKLELPLIGNLIKPLAKSASVPLGLTAAAAATGVLIHNKFFGPGTTTLIISKEEMNVIMKIIKPLEEAGLLIKGVSETTKNKAKEQKGSFLSMLLGTLGASLLKNLLTGKGTVKAGKDTEQVKAQLQHVNTQLEQARINGTPTFLNAKLNSTHF